MARTLVTHGMYYLARAVTAARKCATSTFIYRQKFQTIYQRHDVDFLPAF